MWERVLEPFDQDKEENKDSEEIEKMEGDMWETAFGQGTQEGERAKVVREGYSPTQKEIDEHIVSHLPFRAWCRHCVKGKAKGLPHRIKKERVEEQVPLVSIDYMFMHDKQKEGEERGMPILVMKDRKTRVVRARVVPQKGRNAYAIKILAGMIVSLGYKKILLKSDQEPAVLALKEAVKNELGIEVIDEESPEYDSQANGEVERAIQMVQGQFRAMKDSLETRYEVRFDGDHQCIPWLVSHASDSITRYHVYEDGSTGYRNWKGKPFGKEVIEFGECVLYLKPGSKGKDKFDPRWEDGIWLGIADRTNEVIVGTSEGVIKVRDIRRKGTNKERWNVSNFNEFKGVPWEPIPGREGIEIRARVHVPSDREPLQPPMQGEERQVIPRRARITREQVRMMGFTVGCPGCRAVNRGQPAINHSEECRNIMEVHLRGQGDDRVARADERTRRPAEAEAGGERKRARGEENEAASGHEGPGGVLGQHQEQQDEQQEQQEEQDEPPGLVEESGEEEEKEDEEMISVLEALGIESNIGKWVAKGKADSEAEKELQKKWNKIMLYGRGKKTIKKQVVDRASEAKCMMERVGLVPGLVADFTTNDPSDDRPWDFSKEEKREKARRIVEGKGAMMIVVSPMCEAFARLHEINFDRQDPKEVRRVIDAGTEHIEFCMELCERQVDNSMYFLFEHPAMAVSWRNKKVEKVMKMPGVKRFIGHMVSVNVRGGRKEYDRGWVRKRTAFMTNAEEVARKMDDCSDMHRTIVLDKGKAKVEEVMPDRLCRNILVGLAEQVERDNRAVGGGTIGSFDGERQEAEEFWDDLSGKKLDPKLVRKAREEEMIEFRKHGVYEKVSEDQCWIETGKGPIGVRWVDINKGDDQNPDYRSRLVAQEINRGKREDLFAATPPLEAKKLLLSLAVTEGIGYVQGQKEQGMKIDLIDVRRAYFHAKARRRVFVRLPEEDKEEGKVGLLAKAMYGTRDAAQNWEYEYIDFMEQIGFGRSRATPCMFLHKDREVRVVVHGDDFTILGREVQLDWFREEIAKRFEVKFRARLGPGKNDDKAVRLLNRVIEWTETGIQYEADQRHAELIIKDMGLSGSSNGVVTPGGRKDEDSMKKKLDGGRALQYRAAVARANYMSQDRSDVQYQVKELCRCMSSPSEADWLMLKRLARYLVTHPRSVVRFDYQGSQTVIDAWTDTDYAGCRETRRSTSGGLIMIGRHLIKHWSSTQTGLALSSGEAEYYGLVKGASVAMGIRSMLSEVGIEMKIRVSTDASAAKGIASRRGLGKVRQIEVHQLWVQDKVANGEIEVRKVDGKTNLADMLTKHVDREDINVHMHGTAQVHESGRHELAPRVAE